ncbi:MAG: hypothetical protein ACW99F_12005, partial [Candidatus Hodarchaeales archaeon]
MEPSSIEQLIDQGKLEEASRNIELLQDHYQFDAKLLKAKILESSGDFESAIILAYGMIMECEVTNNVTGLIMTYNIVISCQLKQGELSNASDAIKTIEKKMDGLDLKDKELYHEYTKFIQNKARYLYMGGGLDNAQKLNNECLAFWESHSDAFNASMAFVDIGLGYSSKGDVDVALDYFNAAQEFFVNFGNQMIMGRINDYLGLIYYSKGELYTAIEYFESAIDLFNTPAADIYKSEALYHIIQVSVELGITDHLNLYFEETTLIHSRNPKNRLIDLFFNLGNAQILSLQKRTKSSMEAQRLLEGIIEGEVIYSDYVVEAIIQMFEILLKELISQANEQILTEIKYYMDKLTEVSRKLNSYIVQIVTYLLKSKISLLELNFDEARQLLTYAQTIADNRGLTRYGIKISEEHDNLMNSYHIWEDMPGEDSTLKERLEVAEFDKLIGQIRRKDIFDSSEIIREKPIVFMVVNEAGLIVTMKKFTSEEAINENLIGAFLSAILTFTSEIFSKSK